MPTPEALNSQQNFQFPQEIEVTLVLRVCVNDQEARDYWLNPNTGSASIATLADVRDMFSFDGMDESIITINNLTKEQVQQILNTEAAL